MVPELLLPKEPIIPRVSRMANRRVRYAGCLAGKAEDFALLCPVEREAFFETGKSEVIRDQPLQDGGHDVGSQIGELEQMANIALGNAHCRTHTRA